MTPYHILLVEDEAVMRAFIAERLKTEGYRVSEAENITDAEKLVKAKQPDLIVLDILLPDGSGLDLCRDLRGITSAPILFVTCLGEKSRIIQGLRAGGDDYIVKPFDADELITRIEVQLRRLKHFRKNNADMLPSPLTLEPDERRAKWNGKDLVLSPKEYLLLSVLCRNRNRFTTAEELYSEIWGMSVQQDVRTVKVHISGLRRKLYNVAGEQSLILVFRKDRGYRLEFAADQRMEDRHSEI